MSTYRLPTKMTRVTALLLLLALVPLTGVPAQSIEVRDGANAVGFGLSSEFGSQEQFTLSGYSAFSIAGIMDIGGYLGRQTETFNDVTGDNMTLGFVYNVIPIRQGAGIPFSLQLRLTYGLTLINRDLVVADLLDRFGATVPGDFEVDSIDGSRSGSSLAAGRCRELGLGGPLWLRLGADVEFRSARSTYNAVFSFSGEEETTTPRSVGFRETSLLYIPSAAISLRIPDGPVVSAGSRFWFDEDQQLVVCPELSLIFLQYQ